MPHSVYCSNENNARSRASRTGAFSFPYMQVNSKNLKNWLVFDIDHDNPFIWEDVGLPPPNISVISKGVHKSGIKRGKPKRSSHLYYAIPGVATSVNGREGPIAYMKAIYQAMALLLQADLNYSGPVAKTPGHERWTTIEYHSDEFSLGELAEYVDLESKPKWSVGPKLDDVSHSRNCTLFELTRFYAYSQVDKMRQRSSLSEFDKLIYAYATSHNRFLETGAFDFNLNDSEIRATSKSIARWTWEKYRGTGKHRGVMNLDKTLPLHERQNLAAQRSAKLKRNRSFIAVRNAARSLKDSNKILTQITVAKLAGLTRQTTAKYLPEALKELSPIVALGTLFNKGNNVNLGVHQIDNDLVKDENKSYSFLGRVFGQTIPNEEEEKPPDKDILL